MAVVKKNTYEPGVNNDITNAVGNIDLNRVGLDRVSVEWDGAEFLVKAGSLIEANGSLYAVEGTDASLGTGSGNVVFDSATETFSISTDAIAYKPTLGGWYSSVTATKRVTKYRTVGISYIIESERELEAKNIIYNDPLADLSLDYSVNNLPTLSDDVPPTSGTFLYGGACLGANNIIYASPLNGTNILAIDPGTGKTYTIPGAGSYSGYDGAVYEPTNKRIILVPEDATQIAYHSIGGSSFFITGTTYSGSSKWSGGVLAPNGSVYCIPSLSTTILKINPDLTTSTFGTVSGVDTWSGGVLANDGKIYCVPNDAREILVIDPETDTISVFGTISGTESWSGGALSPDGRIFCMPFTSTNSEVLIIDPSDSSLSYMTVSKGSGRYRGACTAPDGKIYSFPYANGTVMLIIDPISETAEYKHINSLSNQYQSTILGRNGKVYGTPMQGIPLAFYDPGYKINSSTEWMLSPYVNKF